MQNRFSILILLGLLLALPLHAQTTPNDAYKDIQQKIRAKQFTDALTLAQSTLDTLNLSPADKVRFLKIAADAGQAQGAPEAKKSAIAYLEKIIADPTIPNTPKIDTLKTLSETYIASLSGLDLYQMDLAPAQATLERALTLPNLKPEEQATALTNLADLSRRQDKHALARAQYEKALTFLIAEKPRLALQKLIAETYVREGNRDKAQALYAEAKLDPLAFYAAFGPTPKLQEEILRILADPAANEATKWNAYRALPAFNWQATDLNTIHQTGEKYLSDILKQNPARMLTLLPLFKKATPDTNAGFILWAGPIILQSKLSPADAAFVATSILDATAVSQGQARPVTDLAALDAADARLTPQARAHADLVANTLALPSPANIAAALERHKALSSEEKAQALLSAAKTALRAGQEPTARALHQAYLTLLAQLPKAQIACPFNPNAPSDIGSYLASSIAAQTPKAPLDRPYGDNLKFLVETDSAMTGRQADTQSQTLSDDSKTDIQFFADADGIHLFITAYDAQLPQALAGSIRTGGFEMYLAPGPHQPYHTFLGNLPTPDFHPELFLTSYPNPTFRLLSEKDGTFSAQTKPLLQQGAFASHLFFSWQAFYDKLPQNGTKWQFDAIRWTRSGGFSFAGSKSVHNRSSWGDIVFAGLTPENLRAIKRNIIYKALPLYRKARESISYTGNWADPVLGDPAFFNAKVKPLLTRLDQYAPRVTKDMSPEDIDDLFQNAVPGWMELDHTVAALRRQYLQEQLLSN